MDTTLQRHRPTESDSDYKVCSCEIACRLVSSSSGHLAKPCVFMWTGTVGGLCLVHSARTMSVFIALTIIADSVEGERTPIWGIVKDSNASNLNDEHFDAAMFMAVLCICTPYTLSGEAMRHWFAIELQPTTVGYSVLGVPCCNQQLLEEFGVASASS
jgi:hypothetical protein